MSSILGNNMSRFEKYACWKVSLWKAILTLIACRHPTTYLPTNFTNTLYIYYCNFLHKFDQKCFNMHATCFKYYFHHWLLLLMYSTLTCTIVHTASKGAQRLRKRLCRDVKYKGGVRERRTGKNDKALQTSPPTCTPTCAYCPSVVQMWFVWKHYKWRRRPPSLNLTARCIQGIRIISNRTYMCSSYFWLLRARSLQRCLKREL